MKFIQTTAIIFLLLQTSLFSQQNTNAKGGLEGIFKKNETYYEIKTKIGRRFSSVELDELRAYHEVANILQIPDGKGNYIAIADSEELDKSRHYQYIKSWEEAKLEDAKAHGNTVTQIGDFNSGGYTETPRTYNYHKGIDKSDPTFDIGNTSTTTTQPFYRIQIFAARNEISDYHYHMTMSKIDGSIIMDINNNTTYRYSYLIEERFPSRENAKIYLENKIKKHFKDAFIVEYKSVSINSQYKNFYRAPK